jgi:predicted HTH transcriptional regulator
LQPDYVTSMSSPHFNEIMTLYELNEIIENGENQKVEFKRKFTEPDKIAKEMIAFANSKGGSLIFGVDDDRTVVGVESEKGEIEYIDLAAKHFCEPVIKYGIDILHIYKKDVIVVNISESRKKPHRLIEDGKNLNGEQRVYIRLNDKSVLASKETIKVLKNSSPEAPPMIFGLGEREKELLEYLNENERITLKELKEMFNISKRRASRMLVNLVRANLIRLNNYEKEDFYTAV